MEKTLIVGHQDFLSTVMVSAVDGEAVSEQHVHQLLDQDRLNISSTGEFIGKPSTYLCVGDMWVLKLHQKLGLSQKVALQWVNARLKTEKEVGLYHPRRTWFLVEKEVNLWCVGNISPRMMPLHTLVDDKDVDADYALDLMCKVSVDYIEYAAKTGKRLDEGLSNFGHIEGEIYYLDDDLYLWDQFSAFSALLAAWLRRYGALWMNADYAERLGICVSKSLGYSFSSHGGVDAPLTVVEHLQMMFFAEKNKPSVDGIIAGLRYKPGARGKAELKERLVLEHYAEYFELDEPIALIGDVHANLPALNTVLAKIKGMGIQHILDLGDIVGYGPFPAECIQRLQEVGAASVRGNHDHMIGNGIVSESANAVSAWTAKWNMDQLNTELNTWLRSLPLRMLAKPWMAVHGSPQDTTCFNAYVYGRTAERNLHWMVKQGYRFCLHGHSHIPGVYALKGGKVCVFQEQDDVDLSEFEAALICPGSVGQPRGGKVGTQFAVLNPVAEHVSFYHIDYNLEETVEKMIANQFPEKSISRLRIGI
ncbi:MAG: metallophosphoesterase family protein [Mariprofundaceae bacterium]|nr:metallophosphoesterase family protein [Mariprofundaceae bacterium]